MLRISPKTLSNWRSKHKGPPALRYGGIVRYSEARVLAWCEEFTQENSDPESGTNVAKPFSLRRRRAAISTRSRLGSYRTKQDRRNAREDDRPKIDIETVLAGIKKQFE